MMEERNATKKIIGEVLAEIIEDVKNGRVNKVNIGLMAYGSELGSEELLKGAALAMQNDPSVNVVPIGPKVEGFEQMEWIETPACESDISKAMEDALDKGIISGAVALHYPFPLGVTTIGKVLTPARSRPCFIASSTGTSSSNRMEAMVRNAIYGIAAAKADGIAAPTVGILNLDGSQTVLRALQKLSEGGYPITFGSSMRKDGGAILRGNDLLAGSVDVCVTDTLTGNVLMKLFSAWNTGGNYEALGWGYGPSAGENWNKVVSIISRASGAPVVAGAITLNARCAKNGLPAAVAEELKLAKKAGDLRLQGEILIGLGWLTIETGDFAETQINANKVLELVKIKPDVLRYSQALFLLAKIAMIQNTLTSEYKALENILLIARYQDADPYAAQFLIILAEICLAIGQPEQAEVFAQEAKEIAESCRSKRVLCTSLRFLGQARLKQGDHQNGLLWIDKSVSLADQIQVPFEKGLSLRARAACQNDLEKSIQDAQQALQLFEKIGSEYEALQTRNFLTKLNLKNTGDQTIA